MLEVIMIIVTGLVALAAICSVPYGIKIATNAVETANSRNEKQIKELIEQQERQLGNLIDQTSQVIGIQQMHNLSVKEALELQENAAKNVQQEKHYLTEDEEDNLFNGTYDDLVDSDYYADTLGAIGREIDY